MEARTYADITEHLARVLREDARLSEALREQVDVFLGPPRIEVLNRPASVFVYRARVDDVAYAAGMEGVDLRLIWELGLVTQRAADPVELEQQCSILAANVHRILYDHRSVCAYWSTAVVGTSRAGDLRSMGEQSWDVEVVPVEVRLYSVDMRP